MSAQVVRAALTEARSALERLLASPETLQRVSDAGDLMAEALARGNRIFSCGNGGSLCDAMHFAEEMTGRYRKNRRAFGATAIADASHLACVANDFGYEAVFSRYLEGCARPGDVLLAITTSGTSRNVVAAAKTARALGVHVVGLTGKDGTPLTELSDIAIVTPAGAWADRVQELHIKVIHILIELVERRLAPENYQD